MMDQMTDRHFLDDRELNTLNQLSERAKELQYHTALAQTAVDNCIRLAAAKRGLPVDREYRVSPRGELTEIVPPEAPTPPAPEAGPANNTG